MGNPSQSYGASPAIRDQTVWPDTRHRWTCPALTPAMQAGTQFTYPGGMEGWVYLGVGYILRCFTCPQTVTHPSSNHLIVTRPGVEPTTSRSQVQRPNRYTTKPPLRKEYTGLPRTYIIMFSVATSLWMVWCCCECKLCATSGGPSTVNSAGCQLPSWASRYLHRTAEKQL